MIALALLVTGCGGNVSAPAHSGDARLSHVPIHVQKQVERQAALFATRFASRKFDAQWGQLAPTARQLWPSRLARDAMLLRKFANAGVQSVHLGNPAYGVWPAGDGRTDRPSVRAWRVPVAVSFREPRRLQPRGVASDYAGLSLLLTTPSADARPSIVGEGPASADAPVIRPAAVLLRHVHVPILMYHLVGAFPVRSQWTDDYGYAIEYGLTVTPRQFAAEMAYLAARRYHAISLTRLSDALLYGLPLPPRTVAITFDDGRLSPWTNAVPVLRHYGFTATFFVCSGFVGETNQTSTGLNVQRYLSWSQVSDLARDGFWIEDHGQKDINVLWSIPPATLQDEVQTSARQLVSHTGRPVQFLAYTGALWPYPEASQAGPEVQALFPHLSALGYIGAVTDTRVASSQETSAQLWQLPRIRVFPNESITRFASSLH